MIYHVSPQGSDDFAGTGDKPLKTPARALELARQETGERGIIIGEGFYEDVSLNLDERDTGLSIKADGYAVLCGGKKVQGWTDCGKGLYRAKLPEGAPLDFRMITVNGSFCERARFPAEGRLKYKDKFSSVWRSVTDGGWDVQPTEEQLTTLEYDPADIDDGFDWQNAELTVFHRWDESMTGISALDTTNHKIKFTQKLTYPPGAFDSETYIIWNTREGLCKGKWRVDKHEGFLYYMPLDGEDMSKAQVIVPVHESIIKINGNVMNLTFEGLSFTATASPMKTAGFGAMEMPGAIDADTEDMLKFSLFRDLHFSCLSGWAIKLSAKKENDADETSCGKKAQIPCTNVLMENCCISDTGAGGIFIKNICGCQIRKNKVTRIGKIYYSAIGIYVLGSFNCHILENELSFLPYSGIAAAWGANRCRIKGNKISNAVSLINDGGGIYTAMCSKGEIKENLISDILQKHEEPDTTRNGLYLDENSTEWLVEGNLVSGCPSAMMNHLAKNNTIRNNAFVSQDGPVMLSFIRSQAYVVEKNAFQAKGEVTFAHRRGAFAKFTKNLLYSGQDKIESVFVADDYSRSQPEKFNLSPRKNLTLFRRKKQVFTWMI